jgi:cytochrome c biogenesis protein CcmG, thiol:disulfide interchange protein DsbE
MKRASEGIAEYRWRSGRTLIMPGKMKKRLVLLLLLAAFLAPTQAQRVGEMAPDFTLVDAKGEVVRLADFRGTPVVLNFWATWCPPCLEELPLFQEIAASLSEEGVRVAFLLLNAGEPPERARRFLKDEGIFLAVAFDATGEERRALAARGIEADTTMSAMRDYRVRGMPTTFFIDAEGVLQATKVGMVSAGEMSQYLAALGLAWPP